MTQLEAKIMEAKAMKDQFIARARTANTATKVPWDVKPFKEKHTHEIQKSRFRSFL